MLISALKCVDEIKELAEKLLPLLEMDDHNLVVSYVHRINKIVEELLKITKAGNVSRLSSTLNSNIEWLNRRIKEGKYKYSKHNVEDIISRDLDPLKTFLVEYYRLDKRNGLIQPEEIGRGAFATVFKGIDIKKSDFVACKEMFPSSVLSTIYGTEGEEFAVRFKREVRMMREFNHPNVIPIYEAQLEKQPYWFTMPLADFSLQEWINNNQNASEEDRLQLFLKILDGVKYLHKHDKFHRDLAPSNILMFQAGENSTLPSIQIADFGLAKDLQSKSFKTGHSVHGLGHQDYTAPEQSNKLADADHLSDIFSLGGILYFILSNKSPLYRFTENVTLHRIVDKAMRDRRHERYQSIDEFRDAIEHTIKRMRSPQFQSFDSLSSYVYTGVAEEDATYVLDLLALAKSESSNRVYQYFIKPFLSIPRNVLDICCKNSPEVISPFLSVLRDNLEQLNNSIGYPYEIWKSIDDTIASMFYSFTKDKNRLDMIQQLLTHATHYNRFRAQHLIKATISSIPKSSQLAKQVSFLIEDEFSNYVEQIKEWMSDGDYPQEIRFVLNDY
ncbi:serine/threonine-protein kinase [Brevibacillus sp. SYSU BS000544]|uniref:serine/threonine-protein kinase n=1 Tax=Brevibacillus sp. SYSU BS000544 TaxID=3416443 RepID=UPI003CE564A5